MYVRAADHLSDGLVHALDFALHFRSRVASASVSFAFTPPAISFCPTLTAWKSIAKTVGTGARFVPR